jgi:hypothetical protein
VPLFPIIYSSLIPHPFATLSLRGQRAIRIERDEREREREREREKCYAPSLTLSLTMWHGFG